MKRVLLILGWSIGAYIGSAMLLRLLWGVLLLVLANLRYDWSPFGPLFSATLRIAPAVVGGVFLCLAVFGLLPGTRMPSKSFQESDKE